MKKPRFEGGNSLMCIVDGKALLEEVLKKRKSA